jgi:DNA-binding MarR family transcriptional regulator
LKNKAPGHDGRRGEAYVKKRARRFVDRFPWADQKALEITNALNACYNSQRAAIGRAYEELGFQKTLGRSSLLHTLYLADRPMTHSDLRNELEVSQGTVTFLVDGLEKEGLVSREADSTDRRVVYVSLTAKGSSVCESITPGVARLLGRLCDVLSEDEKDQLLNLLLRFLAAAHFAGEGEAQPKGSPAAV